uniref:Two-component sensor histidine kinase n=1 Tax=Clostridioides difficile TaxID=1496 RepID=A0A381I574_CLODI|nr:two-component sensor histidine kinase [Clostridioides difficile]
MNTSVYLLLILALSLIIIAYLVSVLLRVRIQLTLIKDALEDIKNGNLNRRILQMKTTLQNKFAMILTK